MFDNFHAGRRTNQNNYGQLQLMMIYADDCVDFREIIIFPLITYVNAKILPILPCEKRTSSSPFRIVYLSTSYFSLGSPGAYLLFRCEENIIYPRQWVLLSLWFNYVLTIEFFNSPTES